MLLSAASSHFHCLPPSNLQIVFNVGNPLKFSGWQLLNVALASVIKNSFSGFSSSSIEFSVTQFNSMKRLSMFSNSCFNENLLNRMFWLFIRIYILQFLIN